MPVLGEDNTDAPPSMRHSLSPVVVSTVWFGEQKGRKERRAGFYSRSWCSRAIRMEGAELVEGGPASLTKDSARAVVARWRGSDRRGPPVSATRGGRRPGKRGPTVIRSPREETGLSHCPRGPNCQRRGTRVSGHAGHVSGSPGGNRPNSGFPFSFPFFFSFLLSFSYFFHFQF
jgi:hypothetical protein